MNMNAMDLHHDLIKLLISLALGTAIGLEREASDKAAGLRTNILICLGATLFTIISNKFSVFRDPARVAAQIVTGIGFLGAGAIMREGERVTGLTTAATIWIVAAIGMAVGFDYYTLAAAATASVLLVQLAFTPLDILIDDYRQRHTFRVVSKLDDDSLREIQETFRACRVKVIRRKLMKRNGNYCSEWYTKGSHENHEKLVRRLLESKDILEAVY